MSSLRVQLPWQRSGPGIGTTRRHSRVNAAIFHQQQEEAVDEEDDDQQLRLEVPGLASLQREPHGQAEGDHHTVHAPATGERGGRGGGEGARRGGGGGGGPREGGLDMMSAGSWTMSHVHPSASTSSQRERRAQIDSCWCNIPDMFVNPASRAAYYWMALVTVAVVYNWIVIILRVAFEDMRDSEFHQKMFRVLDTLCDVIYLLDVAIQSRTAYLEDGCLVKSLPETVRHYRSQPHFALDVLSVVPLTTVLSYLAKIGLPCPFESGFNTLTTPALRVLRLLKYPSMTRFFEKTDSRTNNPNWLRAFRLSLHLWLVIHWIGCFYYLLSQYEGLGSNDWVYPNTSEYAAFKRKYIFCMYWSTMTLTTIGERPWPVTDVEYIFTGITFLIGVFVFAAVVGNVGDVISNMNAARHDFQARMDQIKFYLNHRNIPEHLQDQIKSWAEYTWARTKAIDEHSVLQMLPSRLRTEVAIHVHLKTLKKVRIFEQCEEGLLRELVLKLKPSIYSPGEYICRIGEIGREMYIIDHGKVEILFPEHGSGQMKQVAIMMPGNYFGEISLLKLDDGQNRRTADVRSVGFSELLCLSRRDLMAALMEYPEAKKILETHARQRMLQTKRTPETESELPMYPPGHSESGHAISGSGFGPGRRSARAIFAQVMRQEGFSKLLASTANEELTEMKKILKELKDIKTQLSQTSLGEREEQSTEDLPRDDDLQQIRTQLLLQTGAMTSSDYMSASGSTLTNAADMSSESGTMISPTVAHVTHAPSGKKKSSSTRNLPLPLKPSTQYAPPDCKVALPGLTSDHPKHSAKITKTLPPFGCSVLPQDIPNPLTLLPSNTSNPEGQPKGQPPVSPRRRRSPSVPKHVDKDQQESIDLLSEALQDTNTLLAVAQGGGGDDPALAAAEKDSPIKDVEEQRKAMLSIQKSISSIDSCTETLSPPTLLGSAVGSHSSFEFLTPSCSSAQKTQQGYKPTLQRANSEQLGMQPSSDSFKGLVPGSNSSSHTSTDYSSTTSTSSGGRGHSPKPAKPRPRYRREDLPPIYTQGNTHKEGSTNMETVSSESERSTNVMLQCKDRGDVPVEGYMSSEGFSIVSMCSSWNSSDSVKSPNTRISPSSSLTQRAATEPTDTSSESTNNKGHVCPVPLDTDTESSDCVVKEVESGENASSKPDQQDSLTECLVDICDGIQGEQTSSQTDSRAEEQMSLGEGRGVTEQIYTSQSPVPAHQTDSDSTTLKMVDGFDEDVAHLDEDDVPGNFSEYSDDSNADIRGAFIAATRVKSDFDKRISEKELADMPRTVTCRKIDDTQLSILLARRREVNDSVDYVVESPGRPRHSVVDGQQLHSTHSEHSSSRLNKCSVIMEKPQPLKSEHSHSIQSVIKNTIESHCANKTAHSAQDNVMVSDPKEISDGKDACKPDEKYEPNSELEDSMFSAESKLPFAKAVRTDVLTPSADPPSQNDSKVQNLSFNENTAAEDIDCIKRDETQTTCVSTDLQDTFSERLDETSKQCLQMIKDEVEGVGTDCSTAAEELRATSGSKDKKYPVSILKKCRPEPQHGNWHDSSNTHMEQPSECSDGSSPVTDTQQLTASMVEDGPDSHLLLNVQKHPDTHGQAEPGTKSHVEAAYDEKYSTMKSSDSEVSDYNRDPSPVVPSAESIPPTLTEENQNETLTTAGQQSPASQCCGQGPGTRGESDEALGTCVDTGIEQKTATTKVEAVSPSRPSSMGSGNRPIVRRHSEKLDSLIAAFDHSMKAFENDLRSGEQKNNTVSITETNTDTNPEKKADSEEAADKSPEECARKPIVTDTVGDHASPRKTSSPLPLSADTEDETKLSSCTASVPAPQKRKTLRRRNAKRASNPYPRRKEQVGKDRVNVSACEDSAELTSSDPGTEGEITTSPKHHTENITTCITLVKNLVWKTDCGESSVSQDREIQFSVSPKEDLSPPYFREKLISNSASQQASSPRASGNLQCDSDLCEDSDKVVDRGREVCAEGSTVPLSYWKEMLGSSGSTTMSASERGSNRRTVSASMAEDGSRETLDRANNSTTAECSSYIGGFSPSGRYVTSYVSHFPGQPATDLVPPDTPVIDHACFEASFGRNTPTSPLRTFPVADLSPAEYLEGLSGGEVESTQRIGTVKQNRNQQNYSKSVHPNAGQSRLAATAATEEFSHESRFHRSMQPGHNNTKPNMGVYPGSDMAGIQHAHSSNHHTGPSDARSDWALEQQQQTAPAGPAETQQCPDSQEEARDGGANLPPPETASQGARVPKRLSGTGMVHALHLHPSLMDSPGASSTDESAGEGGVAEGAAEAMSSLILLADFGVEEDDDDEGALSGLSGCGDHSDINSDLDDL